MSESDFPTRIPGEQAYSPISKYGQISIAEQLARLEEIRNGGRRPAYRPQTSSQESQWGQIQEGFSQVESDLSRQLRQMPPEKPSHPQRTLSPDQDGRSWVQEYREKQRMRKVAQEARAQAEADLQRLLKEREEAQARAQEQERLAAEAAERLRKLEEAEQEALRTAAREQQRREQRVLDAQVAEEKTEAEKMAELLESFQNPPAAPAVPDVAEPPATALPAVPIVHAPAPEQGVAEPVAAPTTPVASESVTSHAPVTPTFAAPQTLSQVSARPAPPRAVSTQHSGITPQAQPVPGSAQTPPRIFADQQGAAEHKPAAISAATSGFAQPNAVAGGSPDGDTTQPIKVTPIDSLADAADDRALADQLALASGGKPVSLRGSVPTAAPAPSVPAAPSKTGPSTLPNQYAAPAAELAQQRGSTQQYPAGSADNLDRPQLPASATNSVNMPAGIASKGGAASGAPLNIAAAGAGSAAELFQQALAQTRQGGATTAAPAGAAAAIASNLAAPAPASPRVTPAPTSPDVTISASSSQVAASPAVVPTAAPVSPAQQQAAPLAARTGSLAAQRGNQVSPRPAPAPPVKTMQPSPGAALAPVAAQPAPTAQPAPAQIPVSGQATPLAESALPEAGADRQTAPAARPVVTTQPAAPAHPYHPAPSSVQASPAGIYGAQISPMAATTAAPAPAATPAGPAYAVAAPAAEVGAAPVQEAVPTQAVAPPITTAAPSESEKSAPPPISESEEPPEEEKTRWWQRKRKAKKAEAPEPEDTRNGASLESSEDQGEEEPLTFIQTFLRWTLRLSILLIIALGMVLTMDRPVISQTMGQDMVQTGIVDEVSVLQI